MHCIYNRPGASIFVLFTQCAHGHTNTSPGLPWCSLLVEPQACPLSSTSARLLRLVICYLASCSGWVPHWHYGWASPSQKWTWELVGNSVVTVMLTGRKRRRAGRGGDLFLVSAKELLPWDFPAGPVGKTLPSNAGGAGSIPGRGAGIPHASWLEDQNIKQKQYCNKINKDF